MDRISYHDGGWWFWSEPHKIAGYNIPGSWVGPFEDREEAEGAMSSSDADDAQAKSEADSG